MTAHTIRPTRVQRLLPAWRLARRLGGQAVLSVTVMAGLQLASVNGYDVRDLFPARTPETAGTQPEPVPEIGVPARFDVPVQAGSALDHISPPPASGTTALPTAVKTAEASAPKLEAPRLAAALPDLDRIAVPTSRPRMETARPAAVAPRPSEVPFDVTPRGVEVYGVAELAAEEAPPVPVDFAVADDGPHVGRLMPPAPVILTRTAEMVTGTAAHAVTGTATRILDLVR